MIIIILLDPSMLRLWIHRYTLFC